MLIVAAIAACHLLAAHLIVRSFWKPARLFDAPAVFLLTAYGCLYGITIVLGWATGRLLPWPAAFLSLGIGIAAWRFGKPERIAPKWEMIRERLRGIAVGEWALLTIIAFYLLVTLVLGSRLPTRTWDAPLYHAQNVLMWGLTDRFDLESLGDGRSDATYAAAEVLPNVKAVLPYLFVRYGRGLEGTAIGQWPYLLLLAALVFAIFRRSGLPRWLALTGVTFSLFAPEVMQQSIELYADVAFLAGQMAVVFVCIVIWQDGYSRRNVLLSALAFAVMAGAKPQALPTGALIGGLLLLATWFREKLPLRARIMQVAATLSVVIAVCLAIAGPWYVKGIAKYHNPIYPFGLQLGGSTLLDGPYMRSVVEIQTETQTGARGFAAWHNTMSELWRQPVISSWAGGLGAHLYILGLPSLFIFLLMLPWLKPRRQIVPIAFLLVVVVMSVPVHLQARYVMCYLVLAGFAFCWILQETARIPRIVLVLCYAALATYNVVRTIPAALYRPRLPELVAYAILSGHTTWIDGNCFPDEYSVADFWRESIASEGRKLAFVGNDYPTRFFPDDKKASIRRIAPGEMDSSSSVWAERLRGLGVTHVYTAFGSPAYQSAAEDAGNFKLVMRRVDGSSEHRWAMDALPDAAIWEVLPPTAGGAAP